MTDYNSLTDENLINLSKTDNNALAFLIYKYDKLVKSICRPYYLVGGDTEDLIQEGMIGLFNAINTYNGTTLFSTYAYRCVKNSVLTAVNRSNCNKNKPLNNFISLSISDSNDIEKNVLITDFNSNPEENFLKQENEIELLNKIKNNLSSLEEKILYEFLNGYSYQEIADKTNKNVKAIDNAIQRIRKKLKKVLN